MLVREQQSEGSPPRCLHHPSDNNNIVCIIRVCIIYSCIVVIVWGAKCVKNDVKRPIYISLPHIYIERDIYISGVIFIYIWVRFIYMTRIYICSPVYVCWLYICAPDLYISAIFIYLLSYLLHVQYMYR